MEEVGRKQQNILLVETKGINPKKETPLLKLDNQGTLKVPKAFVKKEAIEESQVFIEERDADSVVQDEYNETDHADEYLNSENQSPLLKSKRMPSFVGD